MDIMAWLGLSADQIAAILQQWPQIMLCKPSHHDRFDRRVISLAAFKFRHGHLDVPEVGFGPEPSPCLPPAY